MRLPVAGHDVYAYTGTRAFDAALPTVMFVHGAALDHGVFALQSRYFAWHGKNALAVDLPGHGRSQGNALPSVEAIADWLRDVMDAGAEMILFNPMFDDAEQMERIAAQVIPRLG